MKGGWWFEWFLMVRVLECFAESAHASGYLISKSENMRRPPGLSKYLAESCAPPPLDSGGRDTPLATFWRWPKRMTSFVASKPHHFLLTLPSLTILTIINHVRPETQSVLKIYPSAQVDRQSYTNSSLLVGLMSPSSLSPRLGSRKVISNSFLSSSPRSVSPRISIEKRD
jgi:hypothetical protein